MEDFNHKSHIILMKAGPYCGYSLEEIIEIKQKEEAEIGEFFWGYGGVFCRPTTIHAYVIHALLDDQRPAVFFSTTTSAYSTSQAGRFAEYSVDNIHWNPLPSEVLLVGNTNAPHFAMIARGLRKIEGKINLADYCTFRGVLPDPNKYLDSYFRSRVDKACGLYLPRKTDRPADSIADISYACELVEPYCVYIR